MNITRDILRTLIKEELKLLMEVDPTADPEMTVAAKKSPADVADEKEQEEAENAPLVKKAEKTTDVVRQPEEYAAMLKNLLTGTRLSASKKKEAVLQLFGDKEGMRVWAVLTAAAPALKK